MSHDNEKSVAPEQEQISSRPASSDLEKKAGDIQPSTDPSLIEAIGAGSSDGNNLEASGPATKPESIRRQPVKVPRFKRRGLFGGFTVIAEVEEPKDYPDRIKWVITSVVGTAAVAAPLGSTIIFPALPGIIEHFHSNGKVANLSVSLYLIGMSIFPLWWSAFSEILGRRSIYLVSFAVFLLFSALSAVSTSITMLIVLRIFVGGASASVQAVGAGTIADIWEVKERGRAMGFFFLGPLLGPLLGPIIGGLLAQNLGWRSTQWFLVVYGVVLVLLLFFALPETLKDAKLKLQQVRSGVIFGAAGPSDLSRVSTRQSVRLKTKTWLKVTKRTLIDPLRIVLYLRFPAVLIAIYYASVTFSSLYLLNISMEVTFAMAPYNFSALTMGFTYIPGSLGYIFASLFGGRWTDTIMAREAKKAGRYDENGKLAYRPEDRMRENAWIAAFLYPTALIWFGWTADKGVFWAVPLTANFFFGVGSMLIFGMVTTMLTEFMPGNSSAGVALNNCIRNLFSAIGAFAAEPLITAIGSGWLFTGVGIIALMSGGIIWAMKRFGPRWRIKMDRELKMSPGSQK